MIFPKGGAKVEDTALFGKYQICRDIGCGRNGTVFLAKHLALNEYRAIKRVRKNEQDGDGFLREAMILKSLRHPGIPIIYDLEQDQSYYYLIEEYLDGESLFDLVKKQGNLTKAKTISYGIELCQIMNYLHSFKPNPILYLDLQPKNLLICDGALKLIDFDQAVSAMFSGNLKKRYGTVGYAAPEQFTNEPLDVRTDIYAIGALLNYMGTGTCSSEEESFLEKNPKDGLSAVIRQCLSLSKEDRYIDAASVQRELLKLKPGVFTGNQISLLKIAVICSSHGMGATHASLALSAYLSERGISNLYVEQNSSGVVFNLAAYFGTPADENGIFHVRGLDLKPQYGACVKLAQPTGYDVLIEDCGMISDNFCEENYKLILLLCGGKCWEIHDSVKAVRLLSQTKNLRIIFNHISPTATVTLPGNIASFSCHRMPVCLNPEKTDSQMNCFWKEVLDGTQVDEILFKSNTVNMTQQKVIKVRKRWNYFMEKLKK
ncbi:MAG: serine/threonine-protein kinase [Clostridium sp.]